jgi:hypothetical protein
MGVTLKLARAEFSTLSQAMNKLELTGQTLCRGFNFRSNCMLAMHSLNSVAIRPNLELKTQPKQLLGSLPLDIELSLRLLCRLCLSFFTLAETLNREH